MKRREFITRSIGVTAAMTLPFSAKADTSVKHWDREYDLVIVGSGFAGLSAAYSANKAGLKNILVIEKMMAWGGASAICGGIACMPNTPLQKKHGIEDSPELLVKDMLKVGHKFNHLALAETMATQAYTAYDMMIECGVEFKDKLLRLGSHSAPRGHIPVGASGGAIVVPMHKYLLKKGVQFQNRTNVSSILRDKDNGISGVEVQTDFEHTSGEFRNEFSYKSRHGVVIATGGWGSDKQFIKTTMPSYADLRSTAQSGATAGMIKSLLSIGSLPVMLDMYQLGPWGSPDERPAGPGAFFADYAFAEGIAVDPMTGKRFSNELASRRDRSEAQMVVMEQGTKDKPNYPFTFCSEETTTRAEGFHAAYRDGAVFKTNSIAELAEFHGVKNVTALTQSIADWNKIVKGAVDPYNKPLDVRTELKAPFYSFRLSPVLHYCMGGVAITPNAEVIDATTCEPIKGLFAAGEISGGVHGMDRLGGCSSVDGLVFGQIAGRTAANYKANA
ncbi:flavocytochrome c [Shewanella abyssi]|uniref:flavocytochrome c n=1 Tax=Shewanella abyssi TaxID=311789 RepID=UPI00200F6050|nr:flavocytochrome c [Shewanella abyssi]MCL1049702.1 flavocytochrome c [Shewanella abyssi]